MKENEKDKINRIKRIAAAQMSTSHHLRKLTGLTGYPPLQKKWTGFTG
jgi:hypothetical protein